MKKAILLSSLLVSSASMASVMSFDASTLETARTMGHVSVQTLILKFKNGSDFSRYSFLGNFKPFFKTQDGTWGYLKLDFLPDAEGASLILNDLKGDEDILHGYFAPIGKNATLDEGKGLAMDLDAFSEITPNFESRQHYLQDPPRGVGATNAWNIPGGTGKNVKVVDIEVCFEDKHEDFKAPFYLGANPPCGSTDHGTAVWGEVAAKRDGKGVTGIAHDSEFGIYGFIEGEWEEVNDQYISSINAGIQGATAHLDAGDVMIIEQQMVGPDLRKYTAVEYWPHIYEQLKAATDKGINCVQAAGNGDSNMDDLSYAGAFTLSKRDSGCIMVGAVNQGTFERLYFSNYGSRLDAAGFGVGVVTTGYGDLFKSGKERKYTSRFSGTSSATPIVSGVVAVVSSIAKEQGRTITPKEMRAAMRATGVPQGSTTASQRTGSFPVIQQLLKHFGLKG